MTVDVQQIATLGIVAVAAAALGRHLWKGIKGSQEGHCPGCGECGRAEKPSIRPAPKATPLVTLTTGTPPRRFTPPNKEV